MAFPYTHALGTTGVPTPLVRAVEVFARIASGTSVLDCRRIAIGAAHGLRHIFGGSSDRQRGQDSKERETLPQKTEGPAGRHMEKRVEMEYPVKDVSTSLFSFLLNEGGDRRMATVACMSQGTRRENEKVLCCI